MAISDKPMTYKEFRAIQSLLTTELQLTPKEWLKILGTNLDSAGTPQNMLNTSGQVTEVSASSINSTVGKNQAYLCQSVPALFSDPTQSVAASLEYHPKRFQTSVTATAGGEISATAIGPPAIASYQCCMLITHIWSDQTDASIALTFSSTGGLDVGLAAWTIATTAGLIVDYGQGLAWKATADNDTIDVACAAGQAGNAQTLTFCGVYWYET